MSTLSIIAINLAKLIWGRISSDTPSTVIMADNASHVDSFIPEIPDSNSYCAQLGVIKPGKGMPGVAISMNYNQGKQKKISIDLSESEDVGDECIVNKIPIFAAKIPIFANEREVELRSVIEKGADDLEKGFRVGEGQSLEESKKRREARVIYFQCEDTRSKYKHEQGIYYQKIPTTNDTKVKWESLKEAPKINNPCVYAIEDTLENTMNAATKSLHAWCKFEKIPFTLSQRQPNPTSDELTQKGTGAWINNKNSIIFNKNMKITVSANYKPREFFDTDPYACKPKEKAPEAPQSRCNCICESDEAPSNTPNAEKALICTSALELSNTYISNCTPHPMLRCFAKFKSLPKSDGTPDSFESLLKKQRSQLSLWQRIWG